MHGSVYVVVHVWCVDVDGVVMCWGLEKCMCILPGLVGLDLGVGGGLDVDGEEVVGVVSFCLMQATPTSLISSLPPSSSMPLIP